MVQGEATPARVCIVDGNELVRGGMRVLLSAASEFVVVGEAATFEDGVRMLVDQEPAVALVEAVLPGGSGVDLIRRVRHRRPHVRCLVMATSPGHDGLQQALRGGASGYVTKDIGGARLLAAVRRVLGGGTALDWNSAAFVETAARADCGVADLLASLTARERRILDLITEGRTNREIAAELFLAEKTVRNYVSNLLAKLGQRNRTQAAMLMARVTGGGVSGGPETPAGAGQTTPAASDDPLAWRLALACHELRTPVAILGLLGSTPIDDGAPAHRVQTADDILAQVRVLSARLEVIIERYLEHGRQGRLSDATPAPIEVAGEVMATLDRLAPLLPPGRVRLQAAPGGWVVGDPLHLGSIVESLVVNAVWFSDQTHPVDVTVAPRGGHVQLVVTDPGVGLSPLGASPTPPALGSGSHLADPVRDGVGLGLAVAERHVGSMRGTLDVRAFAGKGTRVTVRLPRASTPHPDDPTDVVSRLHVG